MEWVADQNKCQSAGDRQDLLDPLERPRGAVQIPFRAINALIVFSPFLVTVLALTPQWTALVSLQLLSWTWFPATIKHLLSSLLGPRRPSPGSSCSVTLSYNPALRKPPAILFLYIFFSSEARHGGESIKSQSNAKGNESIIELKRAYAVYYSDSERPR